MSDTDLEETMRKGEIRITLEINKETQLQPASVDLRLGRKAFKDKVIPLTEDDGFITIDRSEFVAVQTLEQLHLSQGICGRMGLRSKFTRKGLIMFSGPQIDPGFHGILSLSLFNTTNRPVTMSYGELFCTVEFSRTDTQASRGYSGDYQNQFDFRSEDISYLMEMKGMSFAEVLFAVKSLQESVRGLDNSVGAFKETVESI